MQRQVRHRSSGYAGIRKGGIFFVSAVFSASVLIPLGLGVYAQVKTPTLPHFVKLLFGWQQLIAGFWAIGAALLAGYFVLWQINAARQLEDSSRQAKLQAAKAGLPILLVALLT